MTACSEILAKLLQKKPFYHESSVEDSRRPKGRLKFFLKGTFMRQNFALRLLSGAHSHPPSWQRRSLPVRSGTG